MDFIQLKELINLIDNSKLTEFDLQMDNIIVKMSKNSGEFPNKCVSGKAEALSSLIDEINQPVTIIPGDKKEIKQGMLVTSPIVGTFYDRSAPDKAPFVKVGGRVKAGEILCIVEAMKVMNEITAEHDGEIAEILAVNEHMVEYGQPLFRII